jgi:hypothetical protein
VLRRCIREGLVGGEGFAVDASLIKADANRQNGIEGEKGLPSEAAGQAIEEYLAVLDDAAFGAATEVTPKFVSPADPAARWTGAQGGQAFFAYSTNYLIDVENAIIVDVEATTAIRQAEVVAAKRMIERSIERLTCTQVACSAIAAMALPRCSAGLSTSTGLSRTSPCSTSRLVWMAPSRGRTSLTTIRAMSTSVLGGKPLTTTGTLVNDRATILYRASKHDCQGCALKQRCCPNTPMRKVPRSIYEGARDMARQIASSSEGRLSRRLRKKIEMLFAHLKRILRLDRLRLRGPNGAQDEFILAATAQNLRKLAKLIPMPKLGPI